MPRLPRFLSAGLLVLASVVPGWLAYMIGRNMVINLHTAKPNRMTGYGIFGIEFTGWEMYAFPILCGLVCMGLIVAAGCVAISGERHAE